jgi:hypothetical protein
MDLLPIRRFLDLALPYRVILSTDNGLLEEMIDHRQQINNNQQKRRLQFRHYRGPQLGERPFWGWKVFSGGWLVETSRSKDLTWGGSELVDIWNGGSGKGQR